MIYLPLQCRAARFLTRHKLYATFLSLADRCPLNGP